MNFISYAHNQEDVLLHRALASEDQGFYIDIGAGDPTKGSITKSFYSLGWSGINVEPLPEQFLALTHERTRDINLGVVCTDRDGEATFSIVEGYDELSTLHLEDANLDSEVEIREIIVKSRTLASICFEYVERPIHFLKIDVEGAELSVLQGGDFDQFRPWIVVIEVLWAGKEHPEILEINDFLSKVNYSLVFFDGVNNYYLANERYEDLAPSFAYPVSARDDFVRSEIRLERAIAELAEVLGATSQTDEHEVITRVRQLKADRIKFEIEALSAAGDREIIQSEIISRDETILGLEHLLATRETEADLAWQRSFERERYIAWQSAEAARLRNQIEHLHRSVHEESLIHQNLMRSFTTSSSWRLTLPLRVVRHPILYTKHLFGRS